MARLEGKNILMIIPKDYYNEQELEVPMKIFKEEGAEVLVASGKFKEAVGMRNGRQMPDLLIVDAIEGITGDSYVTEAKGTRQIKGVFHGVVVVGGRGTKKYLWDDKLTKLLISDRFRSKMVVAAIGFGVPCLGKAGLLSSLEATTENDAAAIQVLEESNAFVLDEDVLVNDKIITARNADAAEKFARAVVDAVELTTLK